MQNKKLTYLKEGTNNNDAITKHQLETVLNEKPNKNEVVLVNGSSVLKDHLLMDFNRVQDIGKPCQGKSDTVPYEYFTQWYMKFDDNNI